MDKQHILDEIRRTAKANSGKALGRRAFKSETGIRVTDWNPHYWLRWGDALSEAGFSPNKFKEAFDENEVIEKYAGFVRELGHFPIRGEIRRKSKQDASFPSVSVVTHRRFGGKKGLAKKIINFCQASGGWDDVIQICIGVGGSEEDSSQDSNKSVLPETFGVVYLMKSGSYYKIGKSTAIGRREYELSIQLPEKPSTVHTIKTDDPTGIEAYWHKRFQDKRKKGEWFQLTAEDVKAFKRRKFM